MYCESQYHVLPDETPAICCYVCKQGIHDDCIKDELQKNNSTQEIFKIKGLIWICAECDAAQDDQTTEIKQKQNVQFKEPLMQDEVPHPEVQLQPDIIQNEEVEEGTEPNRNNAREAGNRTPGQSDPRNNEENPAICMHYKRGKCRHGIVGNGCMYRHPKPCKKLLNHGLRGTEGCHKGNECEFLHPQMCRNSLFKKACYNSQCKYRHVRGTWKKDPGDVRNLSRHQTQQQPDANERDAHNFLDIMKVLQSDMQHMNFQIQNLMRNQTLNPQRQLPQQGQYWGNHPQQTTLNQSQRNILNPGTAFAMPPQTQYC